MNAILGFADLAEKRQNEPEMVKDYLYKIKASGDVLLSILNSVLEMAQIEKGDVKIEETVCDIEQFYNSVFTVFEAQIKQKGILFTVSVNARHRRFYCDTAKLNEIFLNILSNAWKYTEPGGKISLRVEELLSNQDGTVLFQTTISDTGRGMSADFLEKIFDAFARERISEKNSIEGTGLGMSIVKRLTERMNGSVDVASKPGEGTVVTVVIPHRVAPQEDAAASDDEISENRFAGKRILLAEDNDINAEIASEILTDVGFSVERAEDGRICVDLVEEKPAHYYDLILMDIQMPNMNGYEASRAIRSLNEPGKSDLPIFALTANTSPEDKQNAVGAGMNRHLGKPIDVSNMLKILADALQ